MDIENGVSKDGWKREWFYFCYNFVILVGVILGWFGFLFLYVVILV